MIFYRDEKGKKQDDWIHDEILQQPVADLATRAQTVGRLSKKFDRAVLADLYGKDAVTEFFGG